MHRKFDLLVRGLKHPVRTVANLSSLTHLLHLIDSMGVNGDGERLVIESWQSALNSHDFMTLAHVSRYQWFLPHLRGRICLDAGCGAGYGTHHLAVNGARKIIGVDISRVAIEYDLKKFKAANLEFRQMDVTKLDFVSGALMQ